MPEEKELNNNDNVDENKGGDKVPELTLESLKEMATDQAEMIEALKTENANSIAQMTKFVQEKYGLMESDMQNLTNLLGGLSAQEGTRSEEVYEDLSDPANVKTLVEKTVADSKKAESEATTKESKTYWDEYGETAQDFMNEDGPDGKPLSKEAREGIKQLMIDTPADRTKNATRDAQKGFKKASRTFFGLDKSHAFKGGDTKGTGGGGSDNKGEAKKVYKLTDDAKEQLKALGETEEWGQEKLRQRAEAELV